MRKFVSSQFGSLMVTLIIGLGYVSAGFIYLFAFVYAALRVVRGPIFLSSDSFGEVTMSRRDQLAAGCAYGFCAFSLPTWVIIAVFNVSFASAFMFVLGLTLMTWLIRGNLPGLSRTIVSGSGIFSYSPDGTKYSWYEDSVNSRAAHWPIGVLKRQLSMFTSLAIVTCGVYLSLSETWPASNIAAFELAQTALIPAMSGIMWMLLPPLFTIRLCLWLVRQLTNNQHFNPMPITA